MTAATLREQRASLLRRAVAADDAGDRARAERLRRMADSVLRAMVAAQLAELTTAVAA